MKIRLGIADAHPVIGKGIAAMLAPYPHIETVFSLTDWRDLGAELSRVPVDILLLDLHMPEQNVAGLCKMLRRDFPECRIVGMSATQETVEVKQVMRAGAAGYLLKSMDEEGLLAALEAVYEGKQYIDTKVKAMLLEDLFQHKKRLRKKDVLTRRETEILELIAREFSSREIADKLFVSLRTVDTHRFNIIQKLQVKNAAGLIKEAYKRGLV
ncbi:LuxR C-terminal-related transcriptional regulator [Chitinophaga sp. NPDC101104]|uniref:LuxR C-terminal-related transcriptional regulator n=1 Tax=Chitinophaga sp. NPDC101104 TaxID=3390561 RepID=UPI003D04B035